MKGAALRNPKAASTRRSRSVKGRLDMRTNVNPSVNIAIPATVDESALPNQGEGRVPPASQARELRPGTESGAPNEGRGAGSSSSALQQWSPFHEAFRYLLQKHQRLI